jgi:hypothetical protein
MKLKGKREARLLALVGFGESLEAACRAVGISRMTVSRHARSDPAFAVLLGMARDEGRASGFDPTEPMDWREAARRLEASDPLRWALPGGGGDPLAGFDFDPLEP